MPPGFSPNRPFLAVLAIVTIFMLIYPCAVLGDDAGDGDQLEGLTDEEKAYVNGLRASCAAAHAALDELLGEFGRCSGGGGLGRQGS